MINRKIQLITSPFGLRTINRKKHFHNGVDLRSVSHKTWEDQEILTPEKCEVLRVGKDRLGNNFLVVKPLESDYAELKFIHIDKYAFDNFEIGQILAKGIFIGYAIKGGSSKAKHLHFEVWINHTNKSIRPINPVEYFLTIGIKYEYK
jgi:murein DD-endopeptidase MepM/ murein hydrolase activator NlpD